MKKNWVAVMMHYWFMEPQILVVYVVNWAFQGLKIQFWRHLVKTFLA